MADTICWKCHSVGRVSAPVGPSVLCFVCGGSGKLDGHGYRRDSSNEALDEILRLGRDAPSPVEFPKRDVPMLYRRKVRVVRAFYHEHEGLMRYRPRYVFRPHALLLFGVEKGATIEMLHSCNVILVEGVDARVFTLLKFHDWMKEGCLVSEQEAAEVPERCKFSFDTLSPSTDIQLEHNGTIESATLFGEELRSD